MVKRKQLKDLVKMTKNIIWHEAVEKARGDLKGRAKKMLRESRGTLKNNAKRGDTRVAILPGVDGKLVSSGKDTREVLAGQYKRLGLVSRNSALDEVFKERVSTLAQVALCTNHCFRCSSTQSSRSLDSWKSSIGRKDVLFQSNVCEQYCWNICYS